MQKLHDLPMPASPLTIFLIFLRLGLTSFGGPIAHLAYFRNEFVTRRRWFGEAGYADLVALCQFLPGPASSQVGFAIGLVRGGYAGALAAWIAFTLPSAMLMVAFAWAAASLEGPVAQGALHGLKLVAVAIVAQAVWGMAKSLTPDWPRRAIALAAIAIVLAAGGAIGQITAIFAGAAAGLALASGDPAPAEAEKQRSAALPAALLALAVILLFALPLLAATGAGGRGLALFEAFYRAGALVFGGGHVVLPLLEQSVVANGWVTQDAFLAGYGVAQAMPGPLFTVAAYLGAASMPAAAGLPGAIIALVAIFLPGLLLVAGMLPFWHHMRRFRLMRGAMAGINAAVVGILAAALYDPLWTSAILSPLDLVLALAGFAALVWLRMPPLTIVAALAVASALAAMLAG